MEDHTNFRNCIVFVNTVCTLNFKTDVIRIVLLLPECMTCVAFITDKQDVDFHRCST